jgi:hypothetical protein
MNRRLADERNGPPAMRRRPPSRRLVITVCPRERGMAALPVERGGPVRRLDARGIIRVLHDLVRRRQLGDRIQIREACAGGCSGRGPNIGVTLYPVPPPGERPDAVAVGWRTYVGTLGTLDCLSRVIDDNLT